MSVAQPGVRFTVQAQLGQRDLRPSLGDSLARTVAASKSAGQ